MSLFSQSPQLTNDTVTSKFLGRNRAIHICLPPSYEKESGRRYPVLYLHDGQNVFTSAGTNVAFGWGNWELDKTANELSKAGKMEEIIMVGIDNGRDRMGEYSGQLHASTTPGAAGSSTNTAFENYAAFLITELKPKIDHEYRTLPGPEHTGVLGSSMGGICSMVLAWEHPDVFGSAGCMSSSFQIEQSQFLTNVLAAYHGPPKPIRIYLDSGATSPRGGTDGSELTAQVAAELRRIGWKEDLQLYLDAKPLTQDELEKVGLRRDKWAEAQISQHNEFYWRLRAWRPLTFLFPPK